MKTLEEISYLHIIEQLQGEVKMLTEENKLLRESIKRYLHGKKENEEPCCGNCISFTNEGIYGDGICCNKEECTTCWDWCDKHKYI